MVVETRINSQGLLEIKHSESNAWTSVVTLLRLASGFDVKLIDSQAAAIESILNNSNKLASILQAAENIQQFSTDSSANLQKIAEISQNYKDVLASIQKAAASTSNSAVDLNTAANSVSSNASKIPDIRNDLRDVKNSLLNLDTLNDVRTLLTQIKTSLDLSGQNIYSDTIALDNPTKEFSRLLPSNIRSLSFSGRKDAYGQSFDLRFAFEPNQVVDVVNGKYQTLWAYNQFYESDILLKNKTLYLACSQPIVVEILAFYS